MLFFFAVVAAKNPKKEFFVWLAAIRR